MCSTCILLGVFLFLWQSSFNSTHYSHFFFTLVFIFLILVNFTEEGHICIPLFLEDIYIYFLLLYYCFLNGGLGRSTREIYIFFSYPGNLGGRGSYNSMHRQPLYLTHITIFFFGFRPREPPSSQTQRRNLAHTNRRLHLNTQHVRTHNPQLHHLHYLYSNLRTHLDHHHLAATHILVTSTTFHTHSI